MTGIYRKTKTSLDRIFMNEDVELDFEDFDDEEAGEETVQITAAAITQICKIYADEDEEQCAALGQAMFSLAKEKGVLDADTVLAAQTGTEEDADTEDLDDLEESEDLDEDEDEDEDKLNAFERVKRGMKPYGYEERSSGNFERTRTGGVHRGNYGDRENENDDEEISSRGFEVKKRPRGRPAGTVPSNKGGKFSDAGRESFRAKMAAKRTARQDESEEDEESIKALRAKFAERRAARASSAKKEEGISESRTSDIRAKIKARMDETKQKTNDPVAMVAEAMSGDLSLFSL